MNNLDDLKHNITEEKIEREKVIYPPSFPMLTHTILSDAMALVFLPISSLPLSQRH